MSEQIILGDIGYNVKFLQFSGAKHLAITLTNNKLTIRNINNNDLVEDTPLDDVTSIKAVNIIASMAGPTTGANLKIKTKHGSYKISWKDVDILRSLGGEFGQDYNQLSGYKKAKLWEDTFQKLKNGQKVETIQNNVDNFEKNITKSKNQKRSTLGLTLIFFPILVFLVGCGIAFVGIHQQKVQNNPLPVLGFLIAILSLGVMPFGIIWGMRKLK